MKSKACSTRSANDWGRLDILVNNASHLKFQHVLGLSFDDWRAGLDPDDRRVPLLPRSALNDARTTISGESSISRTHPRKGCTPPRRPRHIASEKPEFLILTKTFAECATGENLTVNAIAPGTISDSQTKPELQDMPAGRFARYDDIINTVMFLLKPDSAYISGASIKVSGGWDT